MSSYGNSWNEERRPSRWAHNNRRETPEFNNKYRNPSTGSFYDGLPFGKPKFARTNSSREEIPVHPVPPWSQYPNTNTNRNYYSVSNYCEYQNRYKQVYESASGNDRQDKRSTPYENETIKEPIGFPSSNIQINPTSIVQEVSKKANPKPIIHSVKVISEPKVADKLPEKLDRNKIIQLVNSTTKFEPAMQKLLRDKRLQSARELRNKYKNNEIENDDVRADHEALIPTNTLDRFNSLIPDLGVDMEALPPELMEHLNKAIQNTSCFSDELKQEFQVAELEPKIEPLQPPPMPPFLEQPGFAFPSFDKTNLESETEASHINSFMNALELPSNLDECQLEDVSSFFNFTDINVEKDLNNPPQSFNAIPIVPPSQVEVETSLQTTNLSPIKIAESTLNENAEKNSKICFKIPASNLKKNFVFSETNSNISTAEQEVENEWVASRETNSKQSDNDKQASISDSSAYSLIKPMVQIYSISKNSVETTEHNWSKNKLNNDKKEKRNKYIGSNSDFQETKKWKDRRESESKKDSHLFQTESVGKNKANYTQNHDNSNFHENDEVKNLQCKFTDENSCNEKSDNIVQNEHQDVITKQNDSVKSSTSTQITIKESKKHENVLEEKSLKHQLSSFRYNITNEIQNTSRNLLNFRVINNQYNSNKLQLENQPSSDHSATSRDSKKESLDIRNKNSSENSQTSTLPKKVKESLPTTSPAYTDTVKNKTKISEPKVIEDIFDVTDIPSSKNENKTKHSKDVNKTSRVVKQIPLLDTATLPVMKPSSNFNLYSDLGSDNKCEKTNEKTFSSEVFTENQITTSEKENDKVHGKLNNTTRNEINEITEKQETENHKELEKHVQKTNIQVTTSLNDENLKPSDSETSLQKNYNSDSTTVQIDKINETSKSKARKFTENVNNTESTSNRSSQSCETEEKNLSSFEDDHNFNENKTRKNKKKVEDLKKINKSTRKNIKKSNEVEEHQQKESGSFKVSPEESTQFTITEIKSLANVSLNKKNSKNANIKHKTTKKIATKVNKKQELNNENGKSIKNSTNQMKEISLKRKKKTGPKSKCKSNNNSSDSCEQISKEVISNENISDNSLEVTTKYSKEDILLRLMQIDIKIQNLQNEKNELYNHLQFFDDLISNPEVKNSLNQLNSSVQSNFTINKIDILNKNIDIDNTSGQKFGKMKKTGSESDHNSYDCAKTSMKSKEPQSSDETHTDNNSLGFTEKPFGPSSKNRKRRMQFFDNDEDDMPLSKVKSKPISVRSESSLSLMSTTSNATSYSDLSIIKPCSVSLTPIDLQDLSKYNSVEIKKEIIDQAEDFRVEIERFDEFASTCPNENDDYINNEVKVFPIETEESCGSIISKTIQCIGHQGSVLCIKVVDNYLIAGCEDGKLYKYEINSGKMLEASDAHKMAVTCIIILKTNNDRNTNVYSGSLDGSFCSFSLTKLENKGSPKNINNPIQCMDSSWGFVFIGTSSGHLYRYSIENDVITDDQRQLSENSLLAIKATREGGRRVLLVAPRNQLLSVRDAMTGLLLRYVSTDLNATIYSILLSKSIIYCGTNQNFIASYKFENGQPNKTYASGKGVVCLFKYKKLLFAGCYDGYIYIFNLNTNTEVTSIPGPGGMVLSLAVVENRIIVGCKNSCLEIIDMPSVVKLLIV